MKKFFKLFLVVAMLIASIAMLSACNPTDGNGDGNGGGNGGGGTGGGVEPIDPAVLACAEANQGTYSHLNVENGIPGALQEITINADASVLYTQTYLGGNTKEVKTMMCRLGKVGSIFKLLAIQEVKTEYVLGVETESETTDFETGKSESGMDKNLYSFVAFFKGNVIIFFDGASIFTNSESNQILEDDQICVLNMGDVYGQAYAVNIEKDSTEADVKDEIADSIIVRKGPKAEGGELFSADEIVSIKENGADFVANSVGEHSVRVTYATDKTYDLVINVVEKGGLPSRSYVYADTDNLYSSGNYIPLGTDLNAWLEEKGCKVYLSNDSENKETITTSMFSKTVDTSVAGKYEFDINYKNYVREGCSIVVYDPDNLKPYIISSPRMSAYDGIAFVCAKGEQLQFSLDCWFDDGTSKQGFLTQDTEGVEIKGLDINTAGLQIFTIEYFGKSRTLTCYVYDADNNPVVDAELVEGEEIELGETDYTHLPTYQLIYVDGTKSAPIQATADMMRYDFEKCGQNSCNYIIDKNELHKYNIYVQVKVQGEE